ncbi:MAG TPA: hypothetical protein VHR97_04310 [Candidatus Baltobacteraceae bacterium]|jgi:hypothetical protein|nr:hypothetical protein [Candidatus Baltobacteraceae bacterium]
MVNTLHRPRRRRLRRIAAADRRAYLKMRDYIAFLGLIEGTETAFDAIVRQRKDAEGGGGFVYRAAMVPSCPDTVFVLGSFGERGGFSRNDLFQALRPRSNGELWPETRCLIIVDRDGVSSKRRRWGRIYSGAEMRFAHLRLCAPGGQVGPLDRGNP